MIESLLIFLEQTIIPLGAVGVFLASVIEEVIAPIPSALIMTLSGFLFVSGPVDLYNIFRLIFLVAVPAAAGVTLGSLAVYGVAWWGGRAVLERYGKWLGLYWSDVEKFDQKLNESKKDEIAIVSARIIPIIPSVAISAFCGFVRMPFYKYLWITFTGMFVRATILATVGWQIGNVYYRYAELISSIEKYILIFVLIVIALFVTWRLLKIKKIV